MNKSIRLCMGFLLFSVVGSVVAQDGEAMPAGPPKVLVIQREFLKPGRSGMVHQRSESAFVNAMTAAKWPVHYLAMDAMSGRPRSLFMTSYPSYEAWEKDSRAVAGNAVLAAALDKAGMTDGDLQTEYGASVYRYREEMSLRPTQQIPLMRYFEISQYKVKPGKSAEWNEVVKVFRNAYEKAEPEASWAMYESRYGQDNGGYFLLFVPMKSLAELDQLELNTGKLLTAMGADEMKKAEAMIADCVESEQRNLFQFSPKMSYPSEGWIKADPAFWKPKAAVTKKTTAAPAGQ